MKIKNILVFTLIFGSVWTILTFYNYMPVKYEIVKNTCLESSFHLTNLSPGFFRVSGYKDTYLQVTSRIISGQVELLKAEVASGKQRAFSFFILREQECNTYLL